MRMSVILPEAIMSLTLCVSSVESLFSQPEASKIKASASPKVTLTHPEVPRIAALEIKEMLAKKADIVIVDTQPSENYTLVQNRNSDQMAYFGMAG